MDFTETIYFAGDAAILGCGALLDIYGHGGGWGTAIAVVYLEKMGRLSQDILDIYDSGVYLKNKLNFQFFEP